MRHRPLLDIASRFSEAEGTLLLYSGSDYDSANSSFLFLFPFEQIIIDSPREARHIVGGEIRRYAIDDPWDFLKEHLGEFTGDSSWPVWCGYLGYEMGASADREKKLPYFPTSLPDAYFQRSAISFRMGEKIEIKTDEEGAAVLAFPRQRIIENFLREKELELSAEAYAAKIGKVLQLIREGEIYQANLSRDCRFALDEKPFAYFQNTAMKHPAPFSAFLNLGGAAVASFSPERFLSHKSGRLETRPIKGTAPRGKSPGEDLENKKSLLASEKERSELLMITDLMRNDLARVSLPGSIEVEKLWHCEEYANVFHLLSIISSKSEPALNPLDLIRACFPGGSVTGCPKLRAMEAIAELEGRGRGIYTGSIGYFAENGDFDFNIAIRTAVISEQSALLRLGSGIVADSIPEKEYEETQHKGKSLIP